MTEIHIGLGRRPAAGTLSGLAVLLCALCGAAFGEEPPVPPGPPVPPAPPVVPADQGVPPGFQGVKMNFSDTPLETVLDRLSELCGLVILKEVTLEGRITIISKKEMTVDDAIGLLNSALKEKGYVGIRTGKVLKVVKLEDAKRRNIPVRVGADPTKIEPSDEVVTQVIPIKYIDAVQLKKDFAPLVPGYADLSANASSNSLILTDTSANVRRIVEIVHAMDTQSTTVAEVKVFQLKYASATATARLINDTFKEDTSTQGNVPPFMRAMAAFRGGPGGGGGAAQGADEKGQRLRKVTASADDRTNSIVVSANTETMTIIVQLIKDLDANPAAEQNVFVFRCKNSHADNLESIVNTLFSSGSTSRPSTSTGTQRTTGGTSSTGMFSNTGSSSQRSGGMQGLTPSTGSSSMSPAFGTAQQSRGGSGASAPASLSGDLTGQVFAVSDLDTNSLLVLTAAKNFDRVKAILTDLDRPVPQVLIKVLIAEVTHTSNDDVGVEASVLSNGAVKSSLTSFGLAAAQAAQGGLITQLVEQDVSVTIRALQQVGKVDVLSRPYILATDDQLSTITVGQEVPFVTNSMITDTGQTINTIQYQEVGIILNVTAHINNEGLVIMDVSPQVSDISTSTVQITNGVTAPIFDLRFGVLPRAGVKDGQTIVIGGMMSDSKTDNVTGVPVLDKIPGLGVLFRRKTTQKAKTELLFFLTPHVAPVPEALKGMAEDERAGLKLTPKAVGPGVFRDYMRGMQRGAVIVPVPEPEKKAELPEDDEEETNKK